MKRGRSILGAWFLDPSVVFLNHGSFGACPRVVLEAQSAIRERMERRPVQFLVDELPVLLGAQISRLAQLVGALSERMVFVENATQAVNAVVRSLALAPGDELLTTSHVYGAVRQTLRFVAERSGAVVVVAQVPFPATDPGAALASLAACMNERTRLVVVDHLTSPTALVLPVEQVVALCRARGVPVLVDGAHAPGHLPLALDALGADWYTGNAHKWLFAPKGCAFLYARAGAPAVHPTVISHGYGTTFQEEFHWVGTKDPSAWLALGAALDFVDAHGGAPVIAAGNHQMVREASALIEAELGLTPTAPWSMRGAMATFAHPAGGPATLARAKELHDALAAVGVEVPVFPFADRVWFRISAQLYNERADYERLVEALKRSA